MKSAATYFSIATFVRTRYFMYNCVTKNIKFHHKLSSRGYDQL